MQDLQFGVSKKDYIEEVIWTYRVISQCSKEEAEAYVVKAYRPCELFGDPQFLLLFHLPEEQVFEAIMNYTKSENYETDNRRRIYHIRDCRQEVVGEALSVPNFSPLIMVDCLPDEIKLLLMLA